MNVGKTIQFNKKDIAKKAISEKLCLFNNKGAFVKKLLDTYETKMADAFSFRSMAVDIAQEGFNTGNLTPEKVNEMQTYIQMADASMIEAVAAMTTIEVDLGITR